MNTAAVTLGVISSHCHALCPRLSYAGTRAVRRCSSHSLVARLFAGLVEGNRAALAEAITLVESTSKSKRLLALQLMSVVSKTLSSRARKKDGAVSSLRVGLSGPPGAGKSTFIEALGQQLTSAGHRLAVLAVDPSSTLTGGSLLGDKTRMPRLTVDPAAYIRASPTGGHLGGVASATYDAVQLCEMTGYDVVFVETVGVGQSEVIVSDMTDVFILILPPSGGDELQGLKRGIIELCDLVVVNKCDGDLVSAARSTQAEYMSALKFIRPRHNGWTRKVVCVSSISGEGLGDAWRLVELFQRHISADGQLAAARGQQLSRQLRTVTEQLLTSQMWACERVERLRAQLEGEMLRGGEVGVRQAAQRLVDEFVHKNSDNIGQLVHKRPSR